MTASLAPLVVNATELLRRPGSRRRVVTDVALAAVDLDDRRLTGDVAVDVTLESTLDDVVVTGRLRIRRHDACRRCLREIDDVLEVTVDERYRVEPAPADDAFPIVNGQIDLAPMVREEVLLAIPDAPLCRSDCPGLCPICGADLAEGPCGCDTDGAGRAVGGSRSTPGRGLTPASSRSRSLPCAASLYQPSFRAREIETQMAVPKQKKSKSKSRSRRAGAWKLAAPARSVCPRCGNAKTPHTVCPSCGWYKNRAAIDVA